MVMERSHLMLFCVMIVTGVRVVAQTTSAVQSCTGSTAWTPTCNFDDGLCIFQTYSGISNVDKFSLRWVSSSETVGMIPVTHDWQPPNHPNGSYVYLDVSDSSVPLHTKAILSAQLASDITAVCIEFHYATSGTEPQTLRIYSQDSPSLTSTSRILMKEFNYLNTSGQWQMEIVSACLGIGSWFFIAFEGEKVSSTSTIALDYIKITHTGVDCSSLSSTSAATTTPPPTTTTTTTTTIPTTTTTASTRTTIEATTRSVPASSVTTDWQTSNNTTTAPTTSVQRYYQCHVDSVDLAIPVSVVPNSKLHLKESSCQLQNNGTHHVLSFGYHECGTSVAYYTDYIYATNDITVESTLPPNGLVVFADDYTIPLECRFHHEQFVNGAFQAVAIDSTILGRRGGADAADFILREFRTELYQDVITEYPAQIPLNKELFVEIALANANGGTTGIVVKECKATPSNDDNDNTTYTLIQDGCPAQPTVQLQPNPHNEIFRFSLQAFHFADPINQNNMVYLHCDVSICPVTSCTSNCAATKRRRRRSIAQLVDTVTVSSGPYLLV